MSFAASFLPVAAFLSALRSSVRDWRRRDWLFASIGGFAMLVAFIGWVLPGLNQAYRVLAFQAAGGTGVITRGLAELTFSELLDDGSPRALASLTGRVGLAITLPLVLFLASRVTSWSGRRRLALGALALVTYLLFLESPANLLLPHVRAFVWPAVILGVTAFLSRGSRQDRVRGQTIAT